LADAAGSGNPPDISGLTGSPRSRSLLFANVLKKFFTSRSQNENKGATKGYTAKAGFRRFHMLAQIKGVFDRSQATLLQDAVGAVSICVMLWGTLHLPGLF
jgi:hypothetical protein